MFQLFAIVLGLFVLTVAFIFLKVFYEQRRTLFFLLTSVLVGIAGLLIILPLIIPVVLARALLALIFRYRYKHTGEPPRYLERAYQLDEKLRIATNHMLDAVPKFFDYLETHQKSAEDIEGKESMIRSYKAFRRNEGTIEVEVSWDSSLPKNKVTFRSFKKTDPLRKHEDIWDLDTGITKYIERQFIETIKPEKERAKDGYHTIANKGKGVVTYNKQGKLELQYENTRRFERTRIGYDPFEFHHPYFDTKEAKRSRLCVVIQYQDGKCTESRCVVDEIAYGDGIALSPATEETLKESFVQAVYADLRKSFSGEGNMLAIDSGYISLDREVNSTSVHYSKVQVRLETTERKTEVLYPV